MARKYFATRSAVQTPNSDYDAAMAHEQIGPFDSGQEARQAWQEKMARDLLAASGSDIPAWRADFRGQYLGLMVEAAKDSDWESVTHDGVRWVIRSIGQ